MQFEEVQAVIHSVTHSQAFRNQLSESHQALAPSSAFSPASDNNLDIRRSFDNDIKKH